MSEPPVPDGQDEVTEALGEQLHRAAELLLGAIGRADRRCRCAGRPGLTGVPVEELYRGTVTVVMRVFVLLFAEQRWCPPERPAWVGEIGRLGADLERRPAAEPAVDGSGWWRLLALCTAVHQRVGQPRSAATGHPTISLFDPDVHPWLLPLPIDDDTVLGLLRALPGAELDVEQVGYGYQHLLSFAAVRADTVAVGLVGRPGRERHAPLAELTELAARHPDRRALAAALVTRYRSVGLGSPAVVANRLAPLNPAERDIARAALLGATDGDRGLAERVLPFARLVRRDLRGRPVLTLPGAAHLTGSVLRRRTGTHYTPRALAADVVRHALQPLLYRVGPLQTADRTCWEPRSSAEILQLRVADIAMGAGAFLVAAARYLTDALLDARVREGAADPGERDRTEACRQVVERCLFGVDVNPMAAEMATLSLWLLAMDPARPYTVLDERLVVGDSLLGITDPSQPAALLADSDQGAARPTDVEAQTRRAQLVADLAVGAALAGRIRRSRGATSACGGEVRRGRLAAAAREGGALARQVLAGAGRAEATRRSRQWLATDQVPGAFERRPVHWPLVFPEVFARGGFDAVIGNPPFLGGQKLTGALGRAYRELLVEAVGRGARGSADLVAYFVLRAHQLLRPGGQTGFIATNTLAQGDTREIGLDQLVADGITIRRAIRSRPWPARGAKLEYCAVWTSRAALAPAAERHLDDVPVPAITSALEPADRDRAGPYRLAANAHRCFTGSYVLGVGFTTSPERAKELLDADPRNADVLFRYLGGRDVNSDPAAAASRWVINFHDWPEERAREYPACYRQVHELVRPVRERNNRAVYRRYWWHYGEKRPALQAAMAGLSRVVVIALVSRTAMPMLVPTGQVLSHKLGVFASDDPALLALLSSAPHYWWTRSRSSTIKADLNYSPSDVFETLPLPALTPELRALGDRLDEYRRRLMLARRTGLTRTYNLVFDPDVRDDDIAELRRIQRAVDAAAVRAYGWPDLLDRLDHGFHPIGREPRYTIGPAARREILDRLLELNHARHAAGAGGSDQPAPPVEPPSAASANAAMEGNSHW